MEFSEVVQKRRSVRKFTDEPVPEQVIKKALDEGLLAPNSSNLQQWEFYWVKSPDKKQKLIEACLSQNAAKTAQHILVAVAQPKKWRKTANWVYENTASSNEKGKKLLRIYYKQLIPMLYINGPFSILTPLKKIIFWCVGLFRPFARGPASARDVQEVVVKSTALACENIMLSITNQGFSSCPMEGFDESRVKKILGLGCSARVVMCIGIGRARPDGVYGERLRVSKDQVVFEV